MDEHSVSANRRVHHRVAVDEPVPELVVRFAGESGEELRAVAKDASRGGVMVMHEKPLAVATRCEVEFQGDGDVTSIAGTIAHCHRIGAPLYRIGIRFDDELCEESFRRLMGGAGA